MIEVLTALLAAVTQRLRPLLVAIEAHGWWAVRTHAITQSNPLRLSPLLRLLPVLPLRRIPLPLHHRLSRPALPLYQLSQLRDFAEEHLVLVAGE